MHQAQLHAFSGLYTQWLQRQLHAHVSRSPASVLGRGMTPPLTPPPMPSPASPASQDQEEQHADPFQVPEPFLSPTADIILVSLDGIEFRVHRLFLREGSGFFRRMFEDASPSPPAQAKSNPQEPEPERIPFPEPAPLLSQLLTQLYPLPKPPLSLDSTLTLLLLSDKWELALPLQLLKQDLLTRFLDQRPLRVYGFLCSSGLGTQEELERAARACLAHSDPRAPGARQDLVGMSALDLARPLDVRDALAARAKQLVEDIPQQCPHGFPLATSGLIGRWKTALGERLGRNPTGGVLGGWESAGEVLWPEGVAASCRRDGRAWTGWRRLGGILMRWWLRSSWRGTASWVVCGFGLECGQGRGKGDGGWRNGAWQMMAYHYPCRAHLYI
ncbi:hypothetical protein CALVIDRAFT_38454 [Calocera viscosa TUFC12733]|uniref:BTB domain-containing protein n=1 Tax=Calocera viscosa (strain TUFC12733) TaxID=1330018 RepID=A0A167P017_CALVF|nr:hypothetical protein CALVIDRAFT_38454 [Calocera viscosa TUFC12733]